jgi:group I intron endonuclease
MNKYFYIYKITNLINKKVYIGLRRSKVEPEKDNYMGSGKLLREDMKALGKDKFKKQIIWTTDCESELPSLEKVMIMLHKSLFPRGYNLTTGGEYRKQLCQESIEKIRRKATGRIPSDEVRRKMSLAHQNMSAETLDKMRQKRLGKKHSKETKLKIGKGNFNKSKKKDSHVPVGISIYPRHKSKPYQARYRNNYIGYYKSIEEAVEARKIYELNYENKV